MHSTLSLRSFPDIAFETVPMFVWLMMALSGPLRKIVWRFLFPRLSPPGDRWCDVLGFVPACSVISSSTHQIFREAIICVNCFARQSICSTISLHYVMSRAVHPQEFSKVDVDHWHIQPKSTTTEVLGVTIDSTFAGWVISLLYAKVLPWKFTSYLKSKTFWTFMPENYSFIPIFDNGSTLCKCSQTFDISEYSRQFSSIPQL